MDNLMRAIILNREDTDTDTDTQTDQDSKE